jgi:hypothetical protein
VCLCIYVCVHVLRVYVHYACRWPVVAQELESVIGEAVVCVYVYMYVCVHIGLESVVGEAVGCVYVYMYVYTYCVCMYTMHVDGLSLRRDGRASSEKLLCVCMCVYMQVYLSVHMYVHIHIYIYI